MDFPIDSVCSEEVAVSGAGSTGVTASGCAGSVAGASSRSSSSAGVSSSASSGSEGITVSGAGSTGATQPLAQVQRGQLLLAVQVQVLQVQMSLSALTRALLPPLLAFG
ncbi:hypothetical protein [Candidatus Jettenia sp. AMX1]|uniref:hypothetical protein n=1 Tax=Candidatus Jettenia sp. AMX1 TaxID=2293637 RepID=UPI002555E80E|nr:hypothetical protein [Candidatus Jettenia sp. AMX1]MDL1938699.1 hypothetical protein [Candidatus Jettenia sp. AMX1]